MHSLFFSNPLLSLESHRNIVGKNLDQHLHQAGVLENETNYIIELLVPGFDKEDFVISASDNQVQIKAGKEFSVPEGYTVVQPLHRSDKIERSFRFRQAISATDVQATVSKGILTLTVPKKTTEHIVTITAT